ncbi:hypothetical protein OOT46_22935 [Aquabacterium sp. A7-Y]|uniref:NucA/NucB deoxyribonuclease domain-containing protein n=1 Tax=Aquabacterium sp. A7-Y TaxID=1349605 RepID=UPI00223DD31B|nr:hypothetical protein [Aquabacterium sp. A7-Y]MCW7540679.1 hypothetical protein [Aquabacterium sp. A7-Y]
MAARAVGTGSRRFTVGVIIAAACALTACGGGGSDETAAAEDVDVSEAAVDRADVTDAQAAAASGIPRGGEHPCGSDNEFATVTGANNDYESSLVNRHVDCRVGLSNYLTVYEYTRPDPNSGYIETRVGTARVKTQVSAHGPANRLAKRYEIRIQVAEFTPDPNYTGRNPRPVLKFRPRVACTSGYNNSTAQKCTYTAPDVVASTASVGKWGAAQAFDVAFSWTKDPNTKSDWEEFLVDIFNFYYTQNGTPYEAPLNPGGPPIYNDVGSGLGQPPRLRCDKGVAHSGSNGCVFPDAAAVYPLSRSDTTLSEAAQHIYEAQNNPDPAARSPGKFKLKAGTRAIAADEVRGINALQRAKSERVQEKNRDRSCGASNSLIETRLPKKQSASCAAGSVPCSCDEYPFASTWNGGFFNPDRTSVKRINDAHNKKAGSAQLTNWYRYERVVDHTFADDQPRGQPLVPGKGDDFWVFVM